MLTVAEIKDKLGQANAAHLAHHEHHTIALVNEVLPYQRDNAALYAVVGEAYINIRDATNGITWLNRALELDPTLKACHLRMADAYSIQKNRIRALERLQDCKAQFENDPLEGYWWLTRADILKMMRAYEKADEAYQQAGRLLGENAQFFSSYAGFLCLLGRLQEATEFYERAYVLHPNYVWGQHLATHYLTLGRWELGWRLFEIRLEADLIGGWSRRPTVSLKDKIQGPLAFFQEGGLGDLVQMARYIPLFREVSPRLILVCDPALQPLIRKMELGDVELVTEEAIPEREAELPMLSLPLRTGLWTPAEAPAPIKFNIEPRKSVASPAVCINWFGTPHFVHDDLRSAELKDFAPLVRKFPQFNWFCVNVGERVEREIAETGLPITSFQGTLVEACERMAAADAIVTTDTGLAHVAGSLGKPTLMVLRQYPDWRWGISGDTAAWYPSIKLFRTSHQISIADILPALGNELCSVILKTTVH